MVRWIPGFVIVLLDGAWRFQTRRGSSFYRVLDATKIDLVPGEKSDPPTPKSFGMLTASAIANLVLDL